MTPGASGARRGDGRRSVGCGWGEALPRGALDGDLPGLRVLRLGEDHGQDAVLHRGLHPGRVDRRGEDHGPDERTGAALPAQNRRALGGLLFPLAADRQLVVQDADVDVLELEARHIGLHMHRLLVLPEVEGREGDARRAVRAPGKPSEIIREEPVQAAGGGLTNQVEHDNLLSMIPIIRTAHAIANRMPFHGTIKYIKPCSTIYYDSVCRTKRRLVRLADSYARGRNSLDPRTSRDIIP